MCKMLCECESRTSNVYRRWMPHVWDASHPTQKRITHPCSKCAEGRGDPPLLALSHLVRFCSIPLTSQHTDRYIGHANTLVLLLCASAMLLYGDTHTHTAYATHIRSSRTHHPLSQRVFLKTIKPRAHRANTCTHILIHIQTEILSAYNHAHTNTLLHQTITHMYTDVCWIFAHSIHQTGTIMYSRMCV